MPTRSDDRYFGSKPGSAQKAFQAMVSHYGLAEATRVWHSMRNDRAKAGKSYGRAKQR